MITLNTGNWNLTTLNREDSNTTNSNTANSNTTNSNIPNSNTARLAIATRSKVSTWSCFYSTLALLFVCLSTFILLSTQPVAAQNGQLTNTVNRYQNAVGDTVLITIEVTNQSTDIADIVVSAPLPASGLNFVAATASQGSYDHTTGTWAIENADIGTTGTLTIEAIVDFAGYFVSEALLIGDEGVTVATARSTFVAGTSDICYAVADNMSNKFEDQLIGFSLPAGPASYIGATNTFGIEAASADPFRNEIYAIDDLNNDGFTLVRLNITTGQASPIATTSTISDADGLAYDPMNHLLYASTVGVEPELYHINPNTGVIVAGPIALDGCRETGRVDALAVNPVDGQLIGICNFAPEGEPTPANTPDQLFDINSTTGATSKFRKIYINGDVTQPLNDIEGLDYGLDGTLYATTNTGVGAGEQYVDSFFTLKIIDDATVHVLDPPGTSSLDGSTEAVETVDFEGAGCLVTPADLRISQQASTNVVAAGQLVTYTLTVVNATNATAFGIEVINTIPEHTTVTSASDNAQTTLGSRLVNWTIGQMASGEVRTLTVTAQVDSNVPDTVEQLENIVFVSEQTVTGSDPNKANNSATNTVFLPANLEVTKSASAASISPGDSISYTISVVNNGPFDIRGLLFNDQLSDGMAHVEGSTVIEGPAYISVDTIRDRFVGNHYDNNDGTLNWRADWLEIGDDENPSSGNILATIQQGDVRLKVSGANNSIQRSADLSGQPFAELSFQYRREGLQSVSQYVAVQISGDGGTTWAELARFTGHEGDIEYQAARYDISNYLSTETIIRFETPPGDMNIDSFVLFDNVQIDLQNRQLSTDNGSAPPTLATGYDLFVGETMTIVYQVAIDASLSPSITALINTVSVNAPQVAEEATATSSIAITTIGQPTTISGQVREDVDDDGVLTAADSGLSNVTIELHVDDGSNTSGRMFITSTTTDNDGRYQFENVDPGDYLLIEIDPEGYESVSDADGTNDNRVEINLSGDGDSMGNDFLDRLILVTPTPSPTPIPATPTPSPTPVPATPTPSPTPVPATPIPSPTPVPATPTPQGASILGQVREDTDNDGDFVDVDNGIAGVTVELFTDPNSDGDPIDGTLIQTVTTDAQGQYQFNDVLPGVYLVVQTDSPNYTSTGDSNAPNDNRISVTLSEGVDSSGNDFLDALPASTGESPEDEAQLRQMFFPIVVK